MEMVRKEIKKLSQDQGLSVESMQQRAPSIMKKIMESKQWTDFLSQIRLEMSRCCEEVVEDIRRKGDIVVNKSRVSSQSSVSDSLGSTWNQSNFIFMQPEQLEVLVRSLEEDADHRLTALNTLLSSQLSDVVTGQHWSPIKTGLRTCIKDKDSRYERLHKKDYFYSQYLYYCFRVSVLALRIHSRLMMTSNHVVMKESFTNLVETLCSWFTDPCSQLPSCGVSSESRVHVTCLNTVSLILSMARDLTKTWIRFSQTLLEEIISSMVKLISVNCKNYYSPLTLMSIVDHEALWLRDWLHLKVTRTIFFKHVSTQPGVMRRVTDQIESFIETTTFDNYSDILEEMKVNKTRPQLLLMGNTVIQFGSWLHNISLLSRLTFYNQGALVVGDVQKTVNMILNLITLPQTATFPGQTILRMQTSHLFNNEDSRVAIFDKLYKKPIQQAVVENCLSLLTEKIHHVETDLDLISKFREILKSSNINMKVIEELVLQVSGQVNCALNNDWRHLVKSTFGGHLGRILPLIQFSVKTLMLNIDEKSDFCVQNSSSSLLGRHKQDSVIKTIIDQKIEDQFECLLLDDQENLEEADMQEIQMLMSSLSFIKQIQKSGRFQAIFSDPEEDIVKLRFLLSICFNLDCLLHVETTNNLTETLKQAMVTMKADSGEMIDEETLNVQHILGLGSNILGGPSENTRNGLRLTVEKAMNVHKVRKPKLIKTVKGASKDLDEFLGKNHVKDVGWINNLSQIVRELLVTNSVYLETENIISIISGLVSVYNKEDKIESIEALDDQEKSSDTERKGHDLILNYAHQIEAIKNTDEAETHLAMLHNRLSRDLNCSSYDWFVSCVFLMTRADHDISHQLLITLKNADLMVSPLVWHKLGSARHDDQSFQLTSVGYCVEIIMETELPQLTTFLNMETVPVGVILDSWLRQCFINVLDFKEIEQFILFSLLFGADYIVYYCVSVLRHLQELLSDQETSSSGINLYQRIMTQQIHGFHAGDYLPFMDKLATKYRTTILKYFKNCIAN